VSKAPQTESEERAALAYELGWLTSAVWDATGKHPRVIDERLERGGLALHALSTLEIADLCQTIRDEHPFVAFGAP
jgi:hypothetical protein